MKYQKTILFLFVFAFCSIQNPAQIPVCKNGVLDLTNYNFKTNGNIELKGAWCFYWNKFYSFADLQNPTIEPDTFVIVPELWTKMELNGKRLPAFGCATYSLKILTDPSLKNISLYVPNQFTAFELFQNEKSVLKCGNPSESENNHIPSRQNSIIHLKLDTSVNQLTFHISNFNHRHGGMKFRIYMGTEAQINSYYETMHDSDVFLVGVLFIIAVFSFSLYIIRRTDYASLFFALYCLALLFRTLFISTNVFEYYLPHFPYLVALRIEFISVPLSVFFLLFIVKLFPKVRNRYIDYTYIALSSIYALVVLFTPSIFFSKAIVYYQIVLLAGAIYLLTIIFRALMKRYDIAIYILIGFLFIIVSAIVDVLISNNIIKWNFYTSSIATLFFIVFQLIGLVINILQLEKHKVTLEGNLKTINQLYDLSLEVIANLKIENLINSIYQKINHLIRVEYLAIGIYNQQTNSLQFINKSSNGVIQKGQDSLIELKSLSVISYKNEENIFVSEYSNEYLKYLPEIKQPISENILESQIYVPLITKDRKIGVITIQNKEKNSFTEFDFKAIQSIALVVSIAFENAEFFQEIESQRDEILAQKQEIERKNKDVTDSIQYAKRIQDAMLPATGVLQNCIPEHFVLFKPRDIVSGDFYWFKQIKNYIFIAAADCTGHGVPGAFMSMLGTALLNEIIRNERECSAADALNQLRDFVKLSLQQTGQTGEANDGMDIAFCKLDLDKGNLQFAGAFNPLYLIRRNELIEYKGDNMPISIHPRDQVPFANNEIQLQTNDTIYIFSDGYHSQFGGENNNKFKTKKMKETLLKIQEYDMITQKQVLEQTFNDWKGSNDQVDDILVIGWKYNLS